MYTKLFSIAQQDSKLCEICIVKYTCTSGTHTFGAGGKGLFSCNVFGVFFFHFTCFIVRGALFTVFRAKKIAVTSNLERSGDLRTRLKINWKPL